MKGLSCSVESGLRFWCAMGATKGTNLTQFLINDKNTHKRWLKFKYTVLENMWDRCVDHEYNNYFSTSFPQFSCI